MPALEDDIFLPGPVHLFVDGAHELGVISVLLADLEGERQHLWSFGRVGHVVDLFHKLFLVLQPDFVALCYWILQPDLVYPQIGLLKTARQLLQIDRLEVLISRPEKVCQFIAAISPKATALSQNIDYQLPDFLLSDVCVYWHLLLAVIKGFGSLALSHQMQYFHLLQFVTHGSLFLASLRCLGPLGRLLESFRQDIGFQHLTFFEQLSLLGVREQYFRSIELFLSEVMVSQRLLYGQKVNIIKYLGSIERLDLLLRELLHTLCHACEFFVKIIVLFLQVLQRFYFDHLLVQFIHRFHLVTFTAFQLLLCLLNCLYGLFEEALEALEHLLLLVIGSGKLRTEWQSLFIFAQLDCLLLVHRSVSQYWFIPNECDKTINGV